MKLRQCFPLSNASQWRGSELMALQSVRKHEEAAQQRQWAARHGGHLRR